ncbi:alpha/beta hydrolase [Streptomyces sp. ITFR-16]|uniref:dienelactone hydrolase family protein n=1 Tax=Streptomyces sp. ITFR-16 TaxID=3075198 RepID=UPI0028895E38|nr:alpha/beta hydrolase [Streptomyces sp. ITFR-16]WNI26920.1 alpha/beta hydrolase [Streptomyces sp. ITFR-16]
MPPHDTEGTPLPGTLPRFTSEERLDDGVLAREFTLGDIPGTLWTPESAAPLPLILMAHNNGMSKNEPRLVARARLSAAYGYAVASIDAAGCGDRPRSAAEEQARADLRRAMRAGEPVDGIFESFIGPLIEKAAPDWLATLDALLALPEIGGPVGYSGWTALGIRLAVADPRIRAAGCFAGGYVPRAQREEARRVTVPLLLLLQWDDEGNPRQRALDLFDAFGSTEKTLHANMGGHTGTPWFEREDGDRFFGRHLK